MALVKRPVHSSERNVKNFLHFVFATFIIVGISNTCYKNRSLIGG